MLAYLIDGVLLSLVGGAFPFVVLTNAQSGRPPDAAASGSVLVSLVYFVILWSRIGNGRTIGMRVLGLQVTRVDGRELSIRDAIVRWFGLWLSMALCFLGVIALAFDSRKRGWHDKLAGTVVTYS